MRILYVLGFLPPYVTREIEAMAARGHEITVLLPEANSNSETADFWNTISGDPESSSVDVRRILKFKYLTCPVKQLIKPFFRSLRFLSVMWKSVSESEFRYFVAASAAAFTSQ